MKFLFELKLFIFVIFFCEFLNSQKITERLIADDYLRIYTTDKYLVGNVTNSIQIGLKITTKKKFILFTLRFDIEFNENCENERLKTYVEGDANFETIINCGQGVWIYESYKGVIIEFQGSITKFNKGFNLTYQGQHTSARENTFLYKKSLIDTKQILIIILFIVFLPAFLILVFFLLCNRDFNAEFSY